ncbi:3TM-type holin [Thalassovita sp.]|uniref:3TM-type holin n=1 Tax=Thalassovita sp. TaxID=1979401 RepID=UPI002B27A637|nr:3TM-type holin [Thalassovita sp.]
MSAALISLATSVGAPFVRDILSRKIGAGNTQLAEDVITAIAARAGVEPVNLDRLATTDPETVTDAILRTENIAPEMVATYNRELELQAALIEAEKNDPVWVRAWRPLGMYFTMFLWGWQIVILHVLNAIFKTALPPADWQAMTLWTTLYLSLYMGGHTVKSVASTFAAKLAGKGGAA